MVLLFGGSVNTGVIFSLFVFLLLPLAAPGEEAKGDEGDDGEQADDGDGDVQQAVGGGGGDFCGKGMISRVQFRTRKETDLKAWPWKTH